MNKAEHYFENMIPINELDKNIAISLKNINKLTKDKRYIENDISSIKKIFKSKKRLIDLKCFIYTIVSYMVLYLVVYLFSGILSVGKGSNLIYVETAIFALIVFAAYGIEAFVMARKSCDNYFGLKEVRKDVLKCKNESEYIELIKKICAYELMIDTGNENKEHKMRLSDKKIREIKTQIIVVVVTFFISLIVNFSSQRNNQKNFWVYTENDGTTYAVIYQEKDFAVLKKADICGDTISIDLNHQMNINSSGVKLEYMKFENVEKIQ